MSEDKPLHVHVAEALGWADVLPFSVYGVEDGSWCGNKPGSENDSDFVPRYDTDWSATGPLLEKYRICVAWLANLGCWHACLDYYTCPQEASAEGETPLIAVCRLILELKKAGKL